MKTDNIIILGAIGVGIWYFFLRKPKPETQEKQLADLQSKVEKARIELVECRKKYQPTIPEEFGTFEVKFPEECRSKIDVLNKLQGETTKLMQEMGLVKKIGEVIE